MTEMTDKQKAKVRDQYAQHRAHPVAVAVEPQRQIAMDKAEHMARARVAAFAKRIETEGNDLDSLVPYPDTLRVTGRQYHIMMADRGFAKSITRRLPYDHYSYRAPYLVEIDLEAVEKYVADQREMASLQYDIFIVKLVGKIGDCITAVLEGNHVWGESFLTIDGAIIWKTQQIDNRSVHGKWFPQWPSRQVKHKR